MRRPGKFLVSGGLILSSAAWAWFGPRPARIPMAMPMPVTASVAKPAPVAQAAPLPVPQPAPEAPHDSVAMNPPPPVPEAKAKTPAVKEVPWAPPPPGPPPPPISTNPLNAVMLAEQPANASGRYLDGEFIGNAYDGEWGPTQVKLVVKDGKIADVICIVFPYHRQRSAEISYWALPILAEEVIKAQSADIAWVSQASFTSENYQQSLVSALARAHKPS